MKTRTFFLAIGLGLLASIPGWAQERSRDPELVARLEQMLSDADWQARNLTGGAKGKWLLHQAKIRRLVDQLKAGQSVDPREIDEILREHSR